MDRFFHPAGLTQSTLSLDEAESHHASRVLRKSAGDRIEIFDGSGGAAIAEITAVKKDRVDVRIIERLADQPQESPEIHLMVAPPKGERLKWLVEKATELGVDQLTPLLTQRTVVEPGSHKLDKLQSAVVAACKQSGRNRVMQIGASRDLRSCLLGASDDRIFLMGDPLAPVWDPEPLRTARSIVILIGPEGGWSPEELVLADAAGVVRVRGALGVLRTETAAIQFAGLAAWCRCQTASPELPDDHRGILDPMEHHSGHLGH